MLDLTVTIKVTYDTCGDDACQEFLKENLESQVRSAIQHGLLSGDCALVENHTVEVTEGV
jgi:hypothetical protein